MMITHQFFRKLPLLASWLLLTAIGSSETTSRLSTRFLARGEQALLEVAVAGTEPDAPPVIPRIKDVSIQSAGFGAQPRMLPGRKLEYVFRYIVTSYTLGKHTLPAIPVIAGGVQTQTEPTEFQVFDPDDLQWAEEKVGGQTLRYAATFRTLKDNPYEGETIPVEIKVYVPRQLVVEDWGIPEFERDGIASWRFEPTDMRGQVNLLGVPCVSVAYPSTMSATRSGSVVMGPATVRLTTIQLATDGYARREYEEVFLKIPKLELQARALPGDAPEGFENAIGSFSIQAATSEKEVREGDPISVDLTVTGSGNFDTMRPPKLLDPNGWKSYDATPNQRGDERRQLAGNVTFRQFLRALEMKTSLPPFRLVYFDPNAEAYKTVLTEPLALTMLPSTSPKGSAQAPVDAAPVPLERMTDILAIMRPQQWLTPQTKTFPVWILHVIAGVVALLLLAKAFWMRAAPRFSKDPETRARLNAFGEISRIPAGDDTTFLKSAGNFIERWLGKNQDPAVKSILAERDAVCFRSDKSTAVLDSKRRQEILRILRKATLACLLCGVFLLPAAQAADAPANAGSRALTAYEAAKYEEAIQLWLSLGKYDDLSADTLYNIGNASYRLGSPGHAALYYRRALLRDPAHGEALQNLRFLERKYGSLTIARPSYQHAISKISLPTWQATFWTGVWLTGLSLLVFPATRPRVSIRNYALGGVILGPLMACTGGLAWRHFPDDSQFAPLDRQGVIIAEKVELFTDAARTSPAVIDAPPGSLCQILNTSGEWSYISFATKTRGWVPTASLEPLIPRTPPEVPKVRKPTADASNA